VHDRVPGVHDRVPGVHDRVPGVHDRVPRVHDRVPGLHGQDGQARNVLAVPVCWRGSQLHRQMSAEHHRFSTFLSELMLLNFFFFIISYNI
jgi:hypothetical protein